MRIEKLTTKFQEAFGEAQTLALGNDHAFIEPVHVLLAMLKQDDGPKALLQRAGVNIAGLTAAAEAAMRKLPQVQGHEQVQVGRDMVSLLQAAEKESIKRGDQFVAGELFLLALTDTNNFYGAMAFRELSAVEERFAIMSAEMGRGDKSRSTNVRPFKLHRRYCRG